MEQLKSQGGHHEDSDSSPTIANSRTCGVGMGCCLVGYSWASVPFGPGPRLEERTPGRKRDGERPGLRSAWPEVKRLWGPWWPGQAVPLPSSPIRHNLVQPHLLLPSHPAGSWGPQPQLLPVETGGPIVAASCIQEPVQGSYTQAAAPRAHGHLRLPCVGHRVIRFHSSQV